MACGYILVKEECTYHNPIIRLSFILHVLRVNMLIYYYYYYYHKPSIIFVILITFYLKYKVGGFPLYAKFYMITYFAI